MYRKEQPLVQNCLLALVSLFIFGTHNSVFAFFQVDTTFNEYKGIVVDKNTDKPLSAATVYLLETNISTITNNDGEFLIKVPQAVQNGEIKVSYLGYMDQTIALRILKKTENKIELSATITELTAVVIDPKDPEALIKAVMKKRGVNYQSDDIIMTAFYRETIKKRRTYVSLSEAVVDVYKKPYESNKNDVIKLYKARKSTDYRKIDTLALKIMGGPNSTLQIDVMKNPEALFTQNMLQIYDFSFDIPTTIADRKMYVLNFKQKSTIKELLYYGKVYVDAKTLALSKAVFNLRLDDEKKASDFFVRRKPARATVYPTLARYNIDYREKDGKWYYGYASIDLSFKVNWRKRLFNSVYKLNLEMAITDWKKNIDKDMLKSKDRLKPSVVISDEASGFSDPTFWGEYNVIEPEKSIESAIKKIKRQLKK